jgi:hypothetical protein
MPDSEIGRLDATAREQFQHRGTVTGIWRRQNAAEHRVFAARMKGVSPEVARENGARMDDEADVLLDPTTYGAVPVIGTGGEVAADPSEATRHVDTLLGCPDMVAIDASRHRLGLAAAAGGIALALDAAETAQTTNSLEKMLAHQAAAAHIAAMQLQVEALVLLGEFKTRGRRETIFIAEAARLINASARMMDATQHSIITLNRLHTGGLQTVVVQHVHVSGGQAVVAGQVKSRRRARRTPSGG